MRPTQRRAAWWVAALTSLVLACRDEGPPAAPATQPAGADAESPAARGPTQVSVRGDLVSITAREARRRSLLREFAQQAGFELEVGALPPTLLTLTLVDVRVEAALAELLRGIDYRADYRFDRDRGAHVLARVVVGQALPAALAAPAASPPEQTSAAETREDAERNSEMAERIQSLRRRIAARGPEARRESAQVRDAEAVARLGNASAVVRAEAAEEVDVDGPGRERMLALAASDPDPAVRAVAVERLSESDSGSTREALYRALADPAPEVVRAAIEGLDSVGDASSVPYLESVATGHPDPEIRQSAQETLDLLK